MRTASFLVLATVLVCFIPSSAYADELAEAKAALEKAGVRVSAAGVVLAKEGELTKELAKAAPLKRNVLQAQKDLQAAELQLETLQKGLSQLKQQHIQFSARLVNVAPNDIENHNKIVSAIKVTEGQLELVVEQRGKLDGQVKSARGKASQAREEYVELALGSRRLADDIEAEYASKAEAAEVKAALARYNKAAGKQFALAPTAGFQATLRRLKQLEDTVLTDSIDLRDEGKTMRVGVVVNGKYQEEMILDSGASLISVPPSLAAKWGLKPSEKDPKIILQLADGREIDGRLMKLNSVRVGKFAVDNVECAVLGDEAVAAEPLLGMSFLEHFKFEIDSSAKKLTMVKVSGTDSATTTKK